MSNLHKLLIAQHVNEHNGSEEAVHEERLQYQDMVTDELKTKLSALGSQVFFRPSNHSLKSSRVFAN